jgi:hypothetical protein
MKYRITYVTSSNTTMDVTVEAGTHTQAMKAAADTLGTTVPLLTQNLIDCVKLVG